ncbi:MAG: hypothetical protein ACK4PR_08095 [Gammaproteobacteria bacterium]
MTTALNKWTDFPVLARIISDIQRMHQEAIATNNVIIQNANQRLNELAQFSDENWRAQAILKISEEITLIDEELTLEEIKLAQSKEQTAILQLKLDNLIADNIGANFEEQIDNKVEWVISRQALQALQAESKASAIERKLPLQQATVKGLLKIEEELQNRLSSVICDMEAECHQLEERQTNRQAEKTTIEEALVQNQIVIEQSIKDEQQKQNEYQECEANLANHKQTIKIKTNDYEANLSHLNSTLAQAQHHLQELIHARDHLAAEVRQITLRIQYLEGRTTKTIQVDNWVRVNRKTWHGHIWGWRDNWVTENHSYHKQEVDTAVTSEIAEKSRQLVHQQTQLADKERAVQHKTAEVIELQKNISILTETWKKTKSDLNTKNWQLEDAVKEALNQLKDSEARRQQAENERIHLQDSLQRKIQEITHEQKIINDRKKTLAIFVQDLNACLDRKKEIEEKGEKTISALTAMPATETVDIALEITTPASLIELRINAKEALEYAKKEERKFEEKIIHLKNKLTLAKKSNYALTNPNDEMVASNRQEEELSYRYQIEKATRDNRQADETYGETLQVFLLGNGFLVTGYTTINPIDNVIACLLQGIFESYPIYQINSSNNTPLPETWTDHFEKLKQKLIKKKFDNLTEITPTALAQIVDLVNQEYKSDNITLQVSLFSKPLEITPITADHTIQLNLWQHNGQFLVLSPEESVNKNRIYDRAHRLVETLLSSPPWPGGSA